jgi:amino acid adenylation domain-containing protein
METARSSLKTALAANQRVKEKEYWLKKLSGVPVKVHFPYDGKSENGDSKYSRQGLRPVFPGELASLLMEIGSGNFHAVHMLLTAGLMVLLHKYTAADDLVVGMPIYKQVLDSEFINTVVALRNRIIPGMTFKELLFQVRQTITGAVENLNYPMDMLVRSLYPSVEDNNLSLFDVAILLENIHEPSFLEPVRPHVNMIFIFHVTGAAGNHWNLELGVDYNASRYEKSTLERIIAHFIQVMRVVLADTDIKVSGVSMLTEQEKQQLMDLVNGPGELSDPGRTIHELFAQQAERTPDYVSVEGTHELQEIFITYRELNEKSDRLAHLLREKGVQADVIVGLMAERTVEMVIGILAIIKAGGAYLAVDAEYPGTRKKYMLENSGVSLVLTNIDEALQGDFIAGGVQFIDIRDHAVYEIDDGGNPEPRAKNGGPGSGLLYVIYTSGSTGRPKGVMLEHRSLVNLVRFQYCYTTIDFSRVLQFTNISFDVAYQEIFSTLLKGGTLCLADRVVRRDIPVLFRMVERRQIKTLFLPASFVKFVFSSREYFVELPRSAAHIVSAGEQLVVGPLFRQYLEQNNISLHNHYGPSEAHVVTTLTVGPGQKIPGLPGIGRPVANTRIYILDPNKQMLPVGLAGELTIGGIQVGRGYLNQPELTAEKFIDHRSYRTYRSYKTGDLARWLRDGNLEFLGRMDYQVKIRGFRVELGEIENELMKHGAVKEAAVIDRESEFGEKYLCAYIVPGHEGVDIAELEAYLSQTLPGFMVPSYFVWMKEIPLTPNKKVDRQVLPEPVKTAGDRYVPPQTRLEKELAAIWSGVLGIEPQHIGIDDNFFSLGGHSLKATILIARINKVLGVNVLLAQMFTYSTIRELAKHIRGSAGTSHWDIEPVEKKEYYPLSPPQKRLYILQQMDKNNMSYNMPGVLILEGNLEKEKFEQVFNLLIKRHESFRTSFQMVNEEPVQGVHEPVDFEIEYFSLAPGAESAEIIENFVRPFDLFQSPLLRLGLIKSAPQEHMLMFDMHHIITDGTSQGIFTREFLQLYGGQELPLLNLQYKDYSQWQRGGVQLEALKKQGAYWSDRFRGEVPVSVLPYDFPRPLVTRFEGNRLGFLLEEAETRALHDAAGHGGVSLFMVLLAAFDVLLWKLSGQEDIIVGTPIAARRHADLEPIMGMFVNTLVMRQFPTGKKTFKAFLQEVKAGTLEAFENQEYPFEELVEKVNVPRDTGRNPLFDVMFALQNWERAGGEIPGLVVKPYPFENRTAKFDLNLDAMEVAGRISFSLEYSTVLFEESTIRRFTGYFKKIVTQIITPGGIETKLSRLDILDLEEKQQLLEMANGPLEPLDMEKIIPGLFENQVKKSGDGAAVRFVGAAPRGRPGMAAQHLTYKELNRKSNQLAHLLRKKGVGSDTIVGICMEPSLELIIGILGILKAGGAYLPIDPEYPRERIDYMLKDSNALVLLKKFEIRISKFETNPNDKNSNDQNKISTPIVLDFEHLNFEFVSDFEFRASDLRPLGLVYIIYTSGSTGTPKGVMMEHRNLVNLIFYQYRHTGIDFSRVLQFTTISFDVSFQEIFSTLLAGGVLFLVNKEVKQDIPGLLALVDRNKIRTLFLPASFLKFVLGNEAYVQGIPGGVKHIVTAGEQLVVTPVFKEYIISQNIRLHNHYGPSETHVVTSLTLDAGTGKDIPELPAIGRPISNTAVYIVDREGQLQPRGVAGELLIAGAPVGRGYLNRPGLTYKKFLRGPGAVFLKRAPGRRRHPTAWGPYKRIYKTGDLARWQADGTLEFLGRLDSQVKIRGFRVELGEIENSLMASAGIKEAVVTARRDEKGENYLCAYVVPENKVDVNVSLLRQRLSAGLPDFMLPSRFMKLDRIPLTPSKKVDRSALPEPGLSRPRMETAYLAPFTRMEKLIADTWKEILKLDKIGIDDNFFELGGNSLSLIKANNKLKEILKKEIPVMMMFQFTTIHSLAQHLMEEEKQSEISAVDRENRLKKLEKGKARLKETRRKLEGFT